MPSVPVPADSVVPLTPCTGVCRLDDAGLCVGCGRTTDEIARWGTWDNAERLRLMRDVLPARKRAP